MVLSGALIGVLLAASVPLTPTQAFRTFTRASHRGLPQSTPFRLAQDRSGLLWIGTLGGVGSFDGREIATVSGPFPAPGYGAVNDMIARAEGGVYVASGNGIHVYDGEWWRFVATTRATQALAEAGDGALWMLDTAGEVWTLDGESSWRVRPDMGRDASLLAGDRRGGVLVLTRSRGVLRVAADGVRALAGGGLPGAASATALHAAADGSVWVVSSDGVFWTRGDEEWRSVALPPGTARRSRTLGEDRAGRIWVGGLDGWVAFGGTDGPWIGWGSESGLPEGSVTAIMGDREGSVWFGFNGVGLRQWLGEAWTHRRAFRAPGGPDHRLPVFTVTADHSGRGVLAAAFTEGVLHHADGRLRTYGPEHGLTESVQSVAEPQPGTLWVGGRFGIWESRGGERFRRTLDLEKGLVTGLFRDPAGEWWAATSHSGVFRHRDGSWRSADDVNALLEDPRVRGLAWLSDGSFWVATPRGLTVFRGGRGERLSAPGLIESANAVIERPGGEIWVGGVGGISVLREGRWETMSAGEGLPGHTVYSLAVGPDGSVWAGGASGVGRYREGAWESWNATSGLLEEECNLGGLLVQDDGSVYVGTMVSLAHLDPVAQGGAPPPLHLSWRDRPPTDATGVARLESGTPLLRLRWAAPWLTPTVVEFRTRVPRLSEDWSPPSTRDVMELANPPLGRFEVEVAARLQGQQEWTTPLVLEVDVARRLHETWYGRLGIGLALALAALALVRLRTLELRRAADEALANVKVLSGLLPICAACKKVRDDRGYWSQIERYISARSEAQFSHGLCPDCLPRYLADEEGAPGSGTAP